MCHFKSRGPSSILLDLHPAGDFTKETEFLQLSNEMGKQPHLARGRSGVEIPGQRDLLLKQPPGVKST